MKLVDRNQTDLDSRKIGSGLRIHDHATDGAFLLQHDRLGNGTRRSKDQFQMRRHAIRSHEEMERADL